MMLNRILIKISNIQNILSKHNEEKSTVLDDSFISKFLIVNAEGFLLVETCILNEHGFASKLINNYHICFQMFLYIILLCIHITNINSNYCSCRNFYLIDWWGDGKEHITRSLTKLLTNEYAGKCTMSGRGKNIITKMGDTELIKTLASNFTIIYRIKYFYVMIIQ